MLFGNKVALLCYFGVVKDHGDCGTDVVPSSRRVHHDAHGSSGNICGVGDRSQQQSNAPCFRKARPIDYWIVLIASGMPICDIGDQSQQMSRAIPLLYSLFPPQ